MSTHLVRAGLAWWYRQYAPKDTLLAELEAGARVAQAWVVERPSACAAVGVAEPTAVGTQRWLHTFFGCNKCSRCNTRSHP